MRYFFALIISLPFCSLVGAQDHPQHHGADLNAVRATAVAVVEPSKAATTQPTLNNVRGTVTFTQTGRKVKVHAKISGLNPNQLHAIHIHEHADMSSDDLMSTGGHYNPDGHPHGGPTTSPVHAGDFGNLQADGEGNADYTLEVEGITLVGEGNNVVGLPVIIHAKPDDLSSQPAGAAGARIAGGIIRLQSAEPR
jgi:Cu-Zn family superoxide dismutase